MNPKPVQTMVRLSRATAEKVALWASVMDVSSGKLIGIAVDRWELLTPSEAFGLEEAKRFGLTLNAPHKADD